MEIQKSLEVARKHNRTLKYKNGYLIEKNSDINQTLPILSHLHSRSYLQ